IGAHMSRVLLLAVLAGLLVFPSAAGAGASGVVVSQIYGGGGNTGATFRNDYVELFNAGSGTVDLSGWTVQYATAAGTTWQTTPPTSPRPPPPRETQPPRRARARARLPPGRAARSTSRSTWLPSCPCRSTVPRSASARLHPAIGRSRSPNESPCRATTRPATRSSSLGRPLLRPICR